ncbi:unnamed protein product [Musa acuminata subsp. burmannicoides]
MRATGGLAAPSTSRRPALVPPPPSTQRNNSARRVERRREMPTSPISAPQLYRRRRRQALRPADLRRRGEGFRSHPSWAPSTVEDCIQFRVEEPLVWEYYVN